MSVPAANVLATAVPVPAAGAGEAGARRRGALRSAEIAIPSALLILLLFFCFIWPLVYPVPRPVFGAFGPALARASRPAHDGAARLVPPTTSNGLSAERL